MLIHFLMANTWTICELNRHSSTRKIPRGVWKSSQNRKTFFQALVKGQIQLRTPLGLPSNSRSQHHASPRLLLLLWLLDRHFGRVCSACFLVSFSDLSEEHMQNERANYLTRYPPPPPPPAVTATTTRVMVNTANIVITTIVANLDLSNGSILGSCVVEGWPVEILWRLHSLAQVFNK